MHEPASKCETIAVCRITWAEAKAALNNHERQEIQNLSSSLSIVKDLITRYSQKIKYRDNVQLTVDEVTSLVKNVHPTEKS